MRNTGKKSERHRKCKRNLTHDLPAGCQWSEPAKALVSRNERSSRRSQLCDRRSKSLLNQNVWHQLYVGAVADDVSNQGKSRNDDDADIIIIITTNKSSNGFKTLDSSKKVTTG